MGEGGEAGGWSRVFVWGPARGRFSMAFGWREGRRGVWEAS